VAPTIQIKMSLATAGIYCTISPPLSGALEDCSTVWVQQLQILYKHQQYFRLNSGSLSANRQQTLTKAVTCTDN